MDWKEIVKLLKDNPEILKTLLPVLKPIIKEAIDSALNRLVDGVLERI